MSSYLVTGAAGFIGAKVCNDLLKAGNRVVGIDNLNDYYDVRLKEWRLAQLSEEFPATDFYFERLDIEDQSSLEKLFKQNTFDAVLHFAARAGVRYSLENRHVYASTNVSGTLNLLECMRAKTCNKMVMASTSSLYAGESMPFNEDLSVNEPLSPYAASKASSDHLVRAWHETYGLPVIITNCSNNYGPFHFPEKLIPVVILNAISGKQIPIYGKGDNIRDWLYVEDHANALLTVIMNGEIGKTYNIGGENEVTNLDLVNKICALLDELLPQEKPYADQITFVTDRPGHDQRYAIDPSRIRNELNWRPSVTLDEGLRKTVLWYLENRDWWKALQSRDGVGARLGKIK